jgi:hypothetical protein
MENRKPTMQNAQARADQIQAFDLELTELTSNSVIMLSEQQNQSIQSYHHDVINALKQQYNIDDTAASKQLSLGMKIASLVAALAMASSVFFLFFQFWGLFSTGVQVFALVAFSILSFIVTALIAQKDFAGYYAKIAGLISFGCFVLNLNMLGQIYSITPSPNAFLVWSAFGFILAYMCKAKVLLVGAIICFASFISMYFGTWSGMYFISFGEKPENILFASLLVFCLPFILNAIPSPTFTKQIAEFSHFDKVYRVMGMILFFLPVLVLSNWGQGSHLSIDTKIIEQCYQVLGFVSAGLAIWLGVKKQWRHVNVTGNIFFILFLYTKFFDWWWDWLPKYLFFFVMGVVSILLLVLFKRLRSDHHAQQGVKG